MPRESFSERRKHKRLLLTLPMQVQWVHEDGRVFSETCKSINISTGGVYYKSREVIPLGTDTIVALDLPFTIGVTDSGIIRTRGRVIRVDNGEKKKKGIALRFLEELKFSTFYNNND